VFNFLREFKSYREGQITEFSARRHLSNQLFEFYLEQFGSRSRQCGPKLLLKLNQVHRLSSRRLTIN